MSSPHRLVVKGEDTSMIEFLGFGFLYVAVSSTCRRMCGQTLPCLIAVSHAVGRGADLDSHPAMKTGDATVVAALGTQAKVVAKVKVLKEGTDPSTVKQPNPVFFDKLTAEEPLSLTAGTLGAGECVCVL